MDKIYSLDTIFSLSSPAVILENLKTTHTSSSNSLKLVQKAFKVLEWSLLDLVRLQGRLKAIDDLSHADLRDEPFMVLGGEVKVAGRIFLNKIFDQFIFHCFVSASRLANENDSSFQGILDIALAKT